MTRRAQAARMIEWTGERCVPWAEDAQMVYEHLHRYWFAADLARGRDVLDVGSGEGYGAALLAEVASTVVGLEIDEQAVAHSQANYAAPNLSFVQGSALDLGRFDDDSFDLLVCLELIEHLADHDGLLAGMSRVLRPDGLLVLSTPDRRIYTEANDFHNPFHVRELTEPELRVLLAGWFPEVRLWGQRVGAGSNLVELGATPDGSAAGHVVVDRQGERWERAAEPPPVYLVAVASKAPLPSLPGLSTLVDPGLQILRNEERRHQATRVEAALLARERDEMRDHLARLEGEERALPKAQEELQRARSRVAELEAAAAGVDRELTASRARIAALEPMEEFALELQRQLLARSDQVTELEAQTRRLVHAEHVALGRAAEIEALRTQVEQVTASLAQARDAAGTWEALFRYVVGSRGWRVLERLRVLKARLVPGAATRPLPPLPPATLPIGPPTLEPTPMSPAEGEPEPSAPDAPIVFTPPAEPAASIVIPVHDLAAMTLHCLAVLAANTRPDLAEVIIVDDASGDEMVEALGTVQGITVLRHEENLGFLASSNHGASVAAGRHLLFLNNDTEVQPGWLEALLDAVESADDVGAVGSKLVYPDGRLQEAGCIVWSDASAWNVGRGGDAEAPEVTYRREVDYSSANGLIVRRDLFEQLGGFDPRYSPAYYEDVDLCFSLRAAGYRVLYEPRSVIVHREGASHGTDEQPAEGGFSKVHQYANRHVFAAKWSHVLAGHWPPGTAGGMRGGRIDHLRRVLVSDIWVPAHDRDSGSLRMTWILRLLRSLGCAVTLFPQNRERVEPYSSELQRLGVEVHYGPQTFAQFAESRAGLYDIVILSRPAVASDYLEDVRSHFPDALVVYDTVDLHFLREERRQALEGPDADQRLERLRRMELDCARRSDVTWTVTEDESVMIRRLLPHARTATVPNVHQLDSERPRPFHERRDLVFVGGFQHPPNIDAVTWLVTEIMPLVSRELDVLLWVLGSSPPPVICDLQSPRVIVTGYLPDLSEYLRSARVFVSPLRWGAGMKGKNGEAMAYGLPMVTTSVGAEGMHLQDGEHALIRDDAVGLAKAIVELYGRQHLWERLSANGQERVRTLWTPEVVRERLVQLLAQVGPHGADRDPVAPMVR